MTSLLALQDAISTTTSHARNIEQLGAINHVVVYSKQSAVTQDRKDVAHAGKEEIEPSRRATQTPLAST